MKIENSIRLILFFIKINKKGPESKVSSKFLEIDFYKGFMNANHFVNENKA